ncbi:MAG TPA: DUF2795 domain-containing protein [Roseiarcus sp.]|jgi:hypothetical protein
MSMTHVGDSSYGSSRFGGFPYWGSRSRISWGAVVAGAIVAAATSLLLSLLGAAFGAGSVGDLQQAARGEANAAGVGVAIWAIIDLFLSMAFGGYVASRLSGTHSHLDGELHGITMWALATLLGVLGFAGALAGAIAGMGFNMGPAIIGPTASQSVQATPEANPQRLVDRFEASLGRSGNPTTMTHEQIGAEIRSLLGGHSFLTTGALSDANRARLVSLVAAQFGLTNDEATQRVARMESAAKASSAEADQRARAFADEAAQGVASGARALFTSLVFGLLGALIGAWLGTRHKRVLHAHETQIAPPPLATQSYHPYGVLYEDWDRPIAHYLRSVSFPISKQDLLRYARASNAGSDVLHAIDGLADRSYASASDVLAAVELVH